MSYLQGTVYVNDEFRKKVFERTMPRMRGVVSEGKLEVTVPYFYCRDEVIRSLSFLFKDVTKAGYEIRGYSKNGQQPKFRFEQVDGKPYKIDVDMQRLLGSTNKSFSPLSSPYLLRFAIGRFRGKGEYKWFKHLLDVADDKGVKLQTDFTKAWQLNKMTESIYGMYGRMGLTQLRNLTPAGVLSHGTVIDYLEAFPPIEFK